MVDLLVHKVFVRAVNTLIIKVNRQLVGVVTDFLGLSGA